MSSPDKNLEAVNDWAEDEPPPAKLAVAPRMLRQAKLARLVFDCRKCDEDSFAAVLTRGLNLLGRTEVDLVRLFQIRLERAESWMFGSEVPDKTKMAKVLNWLVELTEEELGS